MTLQTWVIYLMFGGSVVVWRSKRERIISHLEGLTWFCAPNVRDFSRVWRVWSCVSLQMWVIYLVFGAFWVVYRSKREVFISCLERVSV